MGYYPSVDWTGNFWGGDVAYAPNSAGCTSNGYPGRLLYGNGAGPAYPVNWRNKQYLSGGAWVTCPTDDVNTRQPSPAYIENGAYDDYERYLGDNLPVLLFDNKANYWNASAATITNWWQNELHGTWSFSHPSQTELGWGLGTLVSGTTPYPGTDKIPSESDYIQANGDDKEAADSFKFGPLDNVAYARAVHDNDGSLWLQYWFFYYLNEQNILGVGEHQGDWEMVQYRIGPNGTPDMATYAQHNDDEAERCSWDKVEKRQDFVPGQGIVRESPVVYVAAQSQASYFVPGVQHRENRPDDSANGEGELRYPTLVVFGDWPPDWVNWPGTWGSTLYQSPREPGLQTTRWLYPSAFNAGAGPCLNPDGTPR